MQNPDRLRPQIDSFIDSTFFTDACLLHTPSQIGLAAVLHAASKEQENLDSYVTDLLFVSAREKLPGLIDAVRSEYCWYARVRTYKTIHTLQKYVCWSKTISRLIAKKLRPLKKN